MSRGLSFAGRVFAPSAAFTVATLLLCALFVRLGAWQWHKGMQRQEEWSRFARGADQVIALGAGAVSDVPLFQRVSVTGRLEGARQFLLDNRTYRGRAG
ncbi:MAG TPA: SURF1 family cytochrome oxidase biogenesis protein, partial [Steroidobacteraceae bacterium]|nr:SURF1 family cytochrome oxidase biogenesis protein [Steroidobacteraceae bacterium]